MMQNHLVLPMFTHFFINIAFISIFKQKDKFKPYVLSITTSIDFCRERNVKNEEQNNIPRHSLVEFHGLIYISWFSSDCLQFMQ